MRKISMCDGCENNFYNGNNPYNVKTCWSLKSAKVVIKIFVPLTMVPQCAMKPEKTLSCYRKRGYVAVDPLVTR